MTVKSQNPQVCRFNDYWLDGHGSIPLCLDGPRGPHPVSYQMGKGGFPMGA